MKDRFQHFTEAKTKFCSHCQNHRPIEGGQQILINKGRNQRFMCNWCLKARKQARAA